MTDHPTREPTRAPTAVDAVEMHSVVMRAQVNADIGTGHLLRCLALAELWIERGHTVCCAVDPIPASLVRRIHERGVEPIVLHDGQSPGELVELVESTAATGIVVDGRALPEHYVDALGATSTPLLALDDGMADQLAADTVLNSSPTASIDHYRRVAPRARLLLGPRFVPLRHEFRVRNRRRPGPSPDRILVTFGGSDPRRLTGPVTAALTAETPADVGIDVLVGASADHSAVADLEGRFPGRVTIHVDHPRPSELMVDTGLAVSGAGSTLWELAYLGVPTLAVAVSVDQSTMLHRPLSEWFSTIDGRAGPPAEIGRHIADVAGRLWAADDERLVARERLLAIDVGSGIDDLRNIFDTVGAR